MKAKNKLIGVVCVVLLVIVAMLTMTACVNTEDNVINVLIPDGAPAFAMAKVLKEMPQQEGYTVKYQVMPGDQIVDRMKTAEADIAILPTNAGALLYNKGIDLKMIGATTFGVMYIVTTDPNVKTLADLEGKTIVSIGEGNVPEFVLRYILQQNNINATIQFKAGGPEIIAGLGVESGEGKITIASLAEPAATGAVGKTGAKIVVDLQKEWANLFPNGVEGYAQSGLFATSNMVANHMGLIDQIVARIKGADEYIKANFAEANALVTTAGGATKLPSVAVLPRCNIGFLSAKDGKAQIEEFFGVLHGLKPQSIGGALPADAFYLS